MVPQPFFPLHCDPPSCQVADQCKENIFAIETLKDFQYFEENKDQGMNVREKAKALVTLLKVSAGLKHLTQTQTITRVEV